MHTPPALVVPDLSLHIARNDDGDDESPYYHHHHPFDYPTAAHLAKQQQHHHHHLDLAPSTFPLQHASPPSLSSTPDAFDQHILPPVHSLNAHFASHLYAPAPDARVPSLSPSPIDATAPPPPYATSHPTLAQPPSDRRSSEPALPSSFASSSGARFTPRHSIGGVVAPAPTSAADAATAAGGGWAHPPTLWAPRHDDGSGRRPALEHHHQQQPHPFPPLNPLGFADPWASSRPQPPVGPSDDASAQSVSGAERMQSPGKTYSFVPLPGNAVKKRPRRRYDEIERLYQCSFTLPSTNPNRYFK
jgi:hypothetical protein